MSATSQEDANLFLSMRDTLGAMIRKDLTYSDKDKSDKVAERLIEAGMIDLYALERLTLNPPPKPARKTTPKEEA